MCTHIHSTHAWGGMKRSLYWEATKDFQDCKSDQDSAVFSCRSLRVCLCLCVCVFQYRDFLSTRSTYCAGQSSRTWSLSIEPTGFNPGRELPRIWTCVRIFAFISLQFNNWSLTIEFVIQYNFCFNILKTSLLYRSFDNARPDRSSRQKKKQFDRRLSHCLTKAHQGKVYFEDPMHK